MIFFHSLCEGLQIQIEGIKKTFIIIHLDMKMNESSVDRFSPLESYIYVFL